MSVVLWVPRVSRMSRWLLFTVENDLCLGITIGDTQLHFATTELRGDWEWHAYTFSMMRNWKHHKFCWRCEATKFDHPIFLDLDNEPAWATTQFSQLQFLARIIHHQMWDSLLNLLGSCFNFLTPPPVFFWVYVHTCIYDVGSDGGFHAWTWGPLILLPKFHYVFLRHCSLHNLNLGLVATANGGASHPVCNAMVADGSCTSLNHNIGYIVCFFSVLPSPKNNETSADLAGSSQAVTCGSGFLWQSGVDSSQASGCCIPRFPGILQAEHNYMFTAALPRIDGT